MSTRRATDGAFNQEKFCSAPELDGDSINALVAAKRISLIQDVAVREMLWFIQWRSLVANGLQQLCADLLTNFPARIGTPALCKFFASERAEPTRVELRNIRSEMRVNIADFGAFVSDDDERDCTSTPKEADLVTAREEADDYQRDAAEAAGRELLQHLRQCCVDPAANLAHSPWYFVDLIGALRELRVRFVAAAEARLADTAVRRQINGALDFWRSRRRMILVEGVAGIGRTATLRAWCDAQGGLVRYVEVPSSADDRSFYVSIARELGVARGMSFSGQQIKVRVEETLRTSGLMIAFDESQYLWGNALRPRRTPDRILWIKTMFDAGTPIALVAHTDFTKWQEHFVKRTLWTDEQFERRINRRVQVAAEHPVDDLLEIARAHFPKGDVRCWKLLAAYALGVPKKRASAIVEALESARYRAEQEGRGEPCFDDIENALRDEHKFLAPAGELQRTGNGPSHRVLRQSVPAPSKPRIYGPKIDPEKAPSRPAGARRATILESAG